MVALAVITTLGTVGYVIIEGWTVFDSFWMVVITLTTIGYGEAHPLSVAGRAFTIALIVSGVSVGAYALTLITRELLEGDLTAELRRRRGLRKMNRLQNHFIVIGFGRLGRAVASELRDAGTPYCVIERDPVRVREAEETLGCPAIVGDGSDDKVLRAAGIERARGVAVAAGMGAESAFATLSVRQLNPTVHIVSRVEDGVESVKVRRAGANGVVSPYAIGGWRMAHALVRPHATHFLDLATLAANEEIVLDELLVRTGSAAVGHTLKDLRVREAHQITVVALRRRDGRLIPVPMADERIEAEDVLIVIGTPEGMRSFAAAVGERI